MTAETSRRSLATENRLPESLNPLFRRVILGATGNRVVAGGVRRYGMRLGASRFVAGETFEECVPVLRRLNEAGLRTNTSLLGEGVREAHEVHAVVAAYRDVLDRIAREHLTTNLAVKLTHLGLDFDEDLAFQSVNALAAHAAALGNFVRIDMEDSPRVDATLRIYRRLRADGHDNVGTVLQSYLYRTGADLDALLPLSPNLRLVKGAYLESPTVAYPKKEDVDAAYINLAERMLASSGFTAIATHDERIIEHVIGVAERANLGPDRFEFQMLYGIRSDLQRSLVKRGYRVLVATPYGPEWYMYLMRRLAERPANLLFFARSVLRRQTADGRRQ